MTSNDCRDSAVAALDPVLKKTGGYWAAKIVKSIPMSAINKANKLKLRAFGGRISAFVNKVAVVDQFADPNPGELNGRKTLVVGGHGNSSNKPVEASFSDVRIRIP